MSERMVGVRALSVIDFDATIYTVLLEFISNRDPPIQISLGDPIQSAHRQNLGFSKTPK